MIGLVRIALRRPYTMAIAGLLIMLGGFLAVNRMVVDIFPNIDIPVVYVAWNYPGLSAEDMERRVVLVSERAYSTTVNGIERIESISIPGLGILKVYFNQGTDIGGAIAQISAQNNSILRIAPPGITPPSGPGMRAAASVVTEYAPSTARTETAIVRVLRNMAPP